jgi:hypothetical protein
MSYRFAIFILTGFLLCNCGEERELPVKEENLTINDKPVVDSVCTSSELITDYYQHYEDILNTLPLTKTGYDVHKAFRYHIQDSSLKRQAQGYLIYNLNHDYGIRLHSKSLPNDLDSVILFKYYDHTIKDLK